MKITVLVDNNTFIDQYYIGEPAVSYYIECQDLRILFDCGYSDIFLTNAAQLRLDLSKLTHIVLSHGHNDHTGGLKYLSEQYDLRQTPLIAHPDCFRPKYYQGENIGAPFSVPEAAEHFHYEPCREPLWLDENCLFLGEIPQSVPWEGRLAIGETLIDSQWQPDLCLDDSALVLRTANGLFIVTGCSHSGIGNIIAQAQKLCGDERIYGILGGLHLLEDNERLTTTVEYLGSLHIPRLYPAHCVSLLGKARMLARFPIFEVGVGLTINL